MNRTVIDEQRGDQHLAKEMLVQKKHETKNNSMVEQL